MTRGLVHPNWFSRGISGLITLLHPTCRIEHEVELFPRKKHEAQKMKVLELFHLLQDGSKKTTFLKCQQLSQLHHVPASSLSSCMIGLCKWWALKVGVLLSHWNFQQMSWDVHLLPGCQEFFRFGDFYQRKNAHGYWEGGSIPTNDFTIFSRNLVIKCLGCRFYNISRISPS